MFRFWYSRVFALQLLLSAVAASTSAAAEDWPATIKRLERGDTKTRKTQLPIAYHNYAMELWEKGELAKATANFEKAADLDRNEKLYKQRLAEVYYQRTLTAFRDRTSSDHQDRKARAMAEKSLRYDKKSVQTHLLIGEIAYDNQELHSAKMAWTRAKMLEPHNPQVNSSLAKLQRESSVEADFRRESHAFFDVRYQKGIDPRNAYRLRSELENARREIGKDFGYLPQHKLVVLVYSEQGFKRIRQGRGQSWWAAYYDGKIRTPLPSTKSGLKQLKPTLYHEYTHAIIHDLSRGHCPRWLNEGLAEFEEAKVSPPSLEQLRTAVRTDSLIPLAKLNDALQDSSHGVAALAYQESFSLALYIADEYGLGRIRRMINQLSEGSTFNEAILSELGLSASELEGDWQDWLPRLLR